VYSYSQLCVGREQEKGVVPKNGRGRVLYIKEAAVRRWKRHARHFEREPLSDKKENIVRETGSSVKNHRENRYYNIAGGGENGSRKKKKKKDYLSKITRGGRIIPNKREKERMQL